jgi:hypothetical protein
MQRPGDRPGAGGERPGRPEGGGERPGRPEGGGNREDWGSNSEDRIKQRQEGMNQRQDQRLEYANEWQDERWEYVDDHWWGGWYGYPYGYPPYGYPATVGLHFHIDLSDKGCNAQPVTVGPSSYTQCGSTYYEKVYIKEEVRYVEVAPPDGMEKRELPNARTLQVGEKTYYVDGFTFYEKVRRDGRDLYVSVDTPVGAEVDSIPESAVKIELDGKTYYQYDSIFYRPVGSGEGASYVVVVPPPAPVSPPPAG